MLNIVASLPAYLSVRHSFCSAEIGVCHRLQLRVMSSFISVKIKWKLSLETLKNFPEFHLPVRQIPSYQSGVVSFIFSFLEHVRCTRTDTVNQ